MTPSSHLTRIHLSPRRVALLFTTLLLLVAGVWAVDQAAARRASRPSAQVSPIHPVFSLRDDNGNNVLHSGAAMSLRTTCGACHDTAFIETHSFHSDLGFSSLTAAGETGSGNLWDTSPGLFGKFDPLTYRYLSVPGDERLDLSTAGWLQVMGPRISGGGPGTTSREGKPLQDSSLSLVESSVLTPEGTVAAWNWAKSDGLEMNCLLCHSPEPNNAARLAQIEAGAFGNASTATMLGSGIVEQNGNAWQWNEDAFSADGRLKQQFVRIQDPTNENCGLCHGTIHTDKEPLVLDACDTDQLQTATTGQVISAQKINASGLNLAGKSELSYAWDIHAERGLKCTDCHYALNNPVHDQETSGKQISHLIYDPRRLELGEYIERPDHNLARGQSAQVTVDAVSKATMRRCESCHDAVPAHNDWLPYTERHMQEVACETCHIPEMHAPAIESYDWTVITPDGEPATACRGIEGSSTVTDLVTGFAPVLMQRLNADGNLVLAPYNLISAWYWIYDDANGNVRPVRQVDLQAAYLLDGAYRPEIMAAFDGNGDGQVSAQELRIDTAAQQDVVRSQLQALGLGNPRIYGQVQPYSISHNVVRGAAATRACQTCHNDESKLDASFTLAAHTPGGVIPQFVSDSNVQATGKLAQQGSALVYQPDLKADGVYLFGHSRYDWLDWAGALIFLATLAGVAAHATLRMLAARRNPPHHHQTERVYMYDGYERFWHWLQTITIMVLLFTGLIIHRPDRFGMFSFRYMVLIHNALAVVLVFNAALSLFWHLTSGQIQQFLPRPRGFFDQAIVQAKFYLKGIFKGSEHPFEKTYRQKLNPLQQLTYLGLLNVLLPLQIVTGTLMWGVQQWPTVANLLGGLPFLGPLHSIVAWLFATFIILHVYLTTTGDTVTEDIKAMITGWENVPVHESHHA
ncbi:MAG: cytochrome b/b6 domain-containing protein [Caldilineales bacterium]